MVFQTVEINPRCPESCLFFLHGLGQSGQGWKEELEGWKSALPRTKIILPTANLMEVSYLGGRKQHSWYQIRSESLEEGEHDIEELFLARETLHSMIEKEVAAGIKREKIFLMGFSQGAALSLFSGLTFSEHQGVGGVVALSGYLPNSKSLKEQIKTISGEERRRRKILVAHGTNDTIIELKYSIFGAELIKSCGYSVNFKEYLGNNHGATPEVLADSLAFLRAHLE